MIELEDVAAGQRWKCQVLRVQLGEIEPDSVVLDRLGDPVDAEVVALGERARFEVPGLSELAFVGNALFKQHPMVYLAIGLAVARSAKAITNVDSWALYAADVVGTISPTERAVALPP